MKTQDTHINKIVNHFPEQKEIVILERVFKHSDGFKGAVGSTYIYYSFEEYKNLTSKSAIMEQIKELELPEGYKSHASAYKAMKANNEIRSFVFDEPEESIQEMIRTELKLKKKDAYIFSDSGGGRMFDKNYTCNINTDLTELIREYEQ